MRGELIGYVVALSTEQNYAGASYLDVDDIIFEEFMSRSSYIRGESDKLMNFWSTVDRRRKKVKLWLVGNTISQLSQSRACALPARRSWRAAPETAGAAVRTRAPGISIFLSVRYLSAAHPAGEGEGLIRACRRSASGSPGEKCCLCAVTVAPRRCPVEARRPGIRPN